MGLDVVPACLVTGLHATTAWYYEDVHVPPPLHPRSPLLSTSDTDCTEKHEESLHAGLACVLPLRDACVCTLPLLSPLPPSLPQQIVSTLEPRAEPAHIVWKGAALMAALDGGRENWLLRHQWVEGGMTQQPPAARAEAAAAAAKAALGGSTLAAGTAGVGGGGAAVLGPSNVSAAAGRHTKLFYYCRGEQGLL